MSRKERKARKGNGFKQIKNVWFRVVLRYGRRIKNPFSPLTRMRLDF